MGMSGIDVWLSNCIRDLHPYGYECKNQEKLSFWGAMKQCVDNALDEELIPILVFKKNYREPHVMMLESDMKYDNYETVFEITSKKLNVWGLIDEYLNDKMDMIKITRDENTYIVISFDYWIANISDGVER